MVMPPDVIDYDVVYELAHPRGTNHTQEFWSPVSERDPDYRAHAAWLDDHSVQLIFDEADL